MGRLGPGPGAATLLPERSSHPDPMGTLPATQCRRDSGLCCFMAAGGANSVASRRVNSKKAASGQRKGSGGPPVSQTLSHAEVGGPPTPRAAGAAARRRHLVSPAGIALRGLGPLSCPGICPQSCRPGATGDPLGGQSTSPALLQGTHIQEWTNPTPWGN